MKKIKALIRIVAVYLSGVLPVRFWSLVEYAGAYFQGKGSGSDFLNGEVVAALRCMPGDNLVIFDIGANHGDWTAELLARAGSRIKTIYQFEPSSENQELLKKKFADDKRIVIVPFAVSDSKGSAELFSDAPGSGMASLHKRRLDHFNVPFERAGEVSTILIDEFIKEKGVTKIDFMKMDIEGHELSALRGAHDSLANGTIKALSFEFGGCDIDSRIYFQDYWYFLTPLGYDLFRILPRGNSYRIGKYQETLECFRTTNYIGIHK